MPDDGWILRPGPAIHFGPMQDAHLCVVQHGLWGSPSDVAMLERYLRAAGLLTLNAASNTARCTFDGADVCGDRLAAEVAEHVTRLAAGGVRVTRLSFAAYSFGGLIARYAAGKLWATGFFSSRGVTPANFLTIASPHLGCWESPASMQHKAYNRIVPYTLSRTGRQLLLADRWLEPEGLPLLATLALPGTAFFAALAAFSKRIALADIRNDRTVPYVTAAMCAVNPYLPPYDSLRSPYALDEPPPHAQQAEAVAAPSLQTVSCGDARPSGAFACACGALAGVSEAPGAEAEAVGTPEPTVVEGGDSEELDGAWAWAHWAWGGGLLSTAARAGLGLAGSALGGLGLGSLGQGVLGLGAVGVGVGIGALAAGLGVDLGPTAGPAAATTKPADAGPAGVLPAAASAPVFGPCKAEHAGSSKALAGSSKSTDGIEDGSGKGGCGGGAAGSSVRRCCSCGRVAGGSPPSAATERVSFRRSPSRSRLAGAPTGEAAAAAAEGAAQAAAPMLALPISSSYPCIVTAHPPPPPPPKAPPRPSRTTSVGGGGGASSGGGSGSEGGGAARRGWSWRRGGGVGGRSEGSGSEGGGAGGKGVAVRRADSSPTALLAPSAPAATTACALTSTSTPPGRDTRKQPPAAEGTAPAAAASDSGPSTPDCACACIPPTAAASGPSPSLGRPPKPPTSGGGAAAPTTSGSTTTASSASSLPRPLPRTPSQAALATFPSGRPLMSQSLTRHHSGASSLLSLSGASAAEPPAPLPQLSQRVRLGLFVSLLPVLLALWVASVLWLGALAVHHYAVLLFVRPDLSWSVRVSTPAVRQLDEQMPITDATGSQAAGRREETVETHSPRASDGLTDPKRTGDATHGSASPRQQLGAEAAAGRVVAAPGPEVEAEAAVRAVVRRALAAVLRRSETGSDSLLGPPPGRSEAEAGPEAAAGPEAGAARAVAARLVRSVLRRSGEQPGAGNPAGVQLVGPPTETQAQLAASRGGSPAAGSGPTEAPAAPPSPASAAAAASAATGPPAPPATAEASASSPASPRALLQGMIANLNTLTWQKVDVDTRHYHAHAAIVVRSGRRFPQHAHILEYAVRQMRA
ncbi:hypothetical protein HYH03_013899 [Edaphochlamys debaryana]|uniref:DUF676 domain-containing protein n=1 Tax=Edaphochlamys debaryana TaxID=47281 RepID=A0A835XQ29_9CHLO|nr:hypothetical protein HYH03_013899 [Edaphochlamys debaryana]|eukprot:KAG2487477.1 hypothetical protein HYH03_013899 [Edaphochlamys debaryana]